MRIIFDAVYQRINCIKNKFNYTSFSGTSGGHATYSLTSNYTFPIHLNVPQEIANMHAYTSILQYELLSACLILWSHEQMRVMQRWFHQLRNQRFALCEIQENHNSPACAKLGDRSISWNIFTCGHKHTPLKIMNHRRNATLQWTTASSFVFQTSHA